MEIPVLGITEQMAWAATAALCFMVLDIITGTIKGAVTRTLNSTKAREGLAHKGSFVLIIVLAWMCEFFVLHVPDLGFNVPLCIPACVVICLTEVMSIVENLAEINPDLKGSRLLGLFGKEE